MRLRYLPIVCVVFATSMAYGQLNYEHTAGMMRILPTSLIKANATITPDEIVTDDECATDETPEEDFYELPWVGNNQYLANLLSGESLPVPGGPMARVEGGNDVKYKIPIKAWVHRETNGSGGISLKDIQILVDRLNLDFRVNRTGIRFYLLDEIDYIHNSDFTVVNWTGSVETWVNSYHVNRAMNIHFVKDIKKAGGLYQSYPKPVVFLEWNTVSHESTVTHEAGHFLGLDHTFRGIKWQGWPAENCMVEPVDHSRNFGVPLCGLFTVTGKPKCSIAGDGLCDTPADYKLDDDDVSRDNQTGVCTLIDFGKKDIYNDYYFNPPSGSYKPDVRNVMSYSRTLCRDKFTNQQLGVMVHSIKHGRNSAREDEWTDPDVVFDTFEPDNVGELSRRIFLNDYQHHTFHTEYSGNVADDIDWLHFEVTNEEAGKFFTFETKPLIFGGTVVDTEITLYSATRSSGLDIGVTTVGSQLATDDNSGDGNYSKIGITLSQGYYAIKFVNKNSAISGDYRIAVYNCADPDAVNISGPGVVCNSGSYTFTLNGAPNNITRLWEAGPGVTVLSGNTGTTYSIRGNGGTESWVKVTLCGNLVLTSNTFHIGGYSSSHYPVSGPDNICEDETAYYQTVALPGATNYTWFHSGEGWSNGSGQGTRYYSVTAGSSTGTVGVRVANECDAGGSPGTKMTSINFCSGLMGFSSYPNPADDEIVVTIPEPEESEENNPKQKTKPRKKQKTYEIVLFNKDQREVLRTRADRSEIRLATRHLPEGIYYLNVIYKDVIKQKQIRIKR